MRYTQLWSQLQLVPSLMVSRLLTENAIQGWKSFALKLDQDPDTDLDLLNVKAPAGIPTISLSTVHLSLSFSCLHTLLIGSPNGSEEHSEDFGDLLGTDYPEVQTSDFDLEIPDWSTNDETVFEESQDMIEWLPSSSAVRRDKRLSPGPSEARKMVTTPASSQHQSDLQIASSSQPSSAPQSTQCPLPFGSILALTDAALRTLIAPNPTRLAKGIKAIPAATATDTSLATLAPSMFSLGYARELSSRASLVPSIAKTLSTFLHYHRKHAPDGASHSPQQDDALSVKENFRCHLWMTMTNGLRDLEKARRLKPLVMPTSAQHLEGRQLPVLEDEEMEMLDSGVAFCTTEDEDEDMLDELKRYSAHAFTQGPNKELLPEDADLSFLEEEFEELCLFDDARVDVEELSLLDDVRMGAELEEMLL